MVGSRSKLRNKNYNRMCEFTKDTFLKVFSGSGLPTIINPGTYSEI
jgi:hypothetical protein